VEAEATTAEASAAAAVDSTAVAVTAEADAAKPSHSVQPDGSGPQDPGLFSFLSLDVSFRAKSQSDAVEESLYLHTAKPVYDSP
jgi:hypothetical protein